MKTKTMKSIGMKAFLGSLVPLVIVWVLLLGGGAWISKNSVLVGVISGVVVGIIMAMAMGFRLGKSLKTVLQEYPVQDFKALRPKLDEAAEKVGFSVGDQQEFGIEYLPGPQTGKLSYPILVQWADGMLRTEGPNVYVMLLLQHASVGEAPAITENTKTT
jgi:tetrahydromethanopterin S-methyltransferase subunit G